jgi:hypothetical protein
MLQHRHLLLHEALIPMDAPRHHTIIEQVMQNHRSTGEGFRQGRRCTVAAERIQRRDEEEVHPTTI